MNSQGTFQLQIEYCEINMNTLHSYGKGKGERERERERENKHERFCQHKSKVQHELGCPEKFKWTINFAKTTSEKQIQCSGST